MDNCLATMNVENQDKQWMAAVSFVLRKEKEVLTEDLAMELYRIADFSLEVRYDFSSSKDMAIFVPNDGIKKPAALPVTEILKDTKCLFKIRDSVPIDERLFPIIRKMIDLAQKNRSQTYTHQQIGFTSLPAGDVFLYKNVVGLAKGKYDFFYSGCLDLFSKGTKDAMISFIREHVVGNLCMEVALISAFLGVITQALGLEWISSLIFYLNNYKEQRTLNQFLLGSICNPQNVFQSFTQIRNQKDTDCFQRLQQLKVIPYCITGEEIEESELEPISIELAHMIQNVFRDKQSRKDFMSANHDTEYFSPLILSLPEQMSSTFATQLSKDQYFSVLELRFPDSSTIQKCTRELERLLRNNRAVLMEPFVQYLFDSRNLGDNLLDRYDDIVDHLIADNEDVPYWDTLCDRMALLILTEQLVNEAFGLNCNIDTMEQFLIEQAKEQIIACKTQKYYEDFLRKFVEEHEVNFADCNERFEFNSPMIGECLGVVRNLSNDGIEITIPTDKIGKIFQHSNDSENTDTLGNEANIVADKHFLNLALAALDKAGAIQKTHTRKEERFCYRKLGSYDSRSVSCYVFRLE